MKETLLTVAAIIAGAVILVYVVVAVRVYNFKKKTDKYGGHND